MFELLVLIVIAQLGLSALKFFGLK